MKQPNTSKAKGHNQANALIYIVDDEPLLLDLAELALKPEGYRLRKFQDPARAYRACARARAKPALILSDYAMGRHNGLDFLAKCKRVHPALKSVLISGTVGPEIILNAPLAINRFLSKPYQPEALAALVREVLAE